MKDIIIFFVLYLTGVLAFLEVPTNYHDAIGIPTAKRIKDLEEAIQANQTGTIEDRIIGGKLAPLNAYPFFAGLHISLVGTPNTSVCGSTLLSPSRVVTAAHCNFDGVELASEFTVVLGSNFLYNGGERIATRQVVMHPYYIPGVANDIAMLYLPTNVIFTDIIHPIRLPYISELDNLFVGYEAIAVGFGSTSDTHQNIAEDILSYVMLQVIDNAECKPFRVTPNIICTSGVGPVGPVGICSGDSGGPLFTLDSNGNPLLIGITAFRSRLNGCEGGDPSGFTRVTRYMDFIISNLDITL